MGLSQIGGAGICLFLERSEERTDTGGAHPDNGLIFAPGGNPAAARFTPGIPPKAGQMPRLAPQI